MPNPTAAMLVIGDEILSGRTRDANMHHLAQKLTEHGIDLCEVRVVSDDAPAIITAVRALSGQYTHVFTSGGIGPTHDDITADCIAEAFGRAIDVRDDARKLLADLCAARGVELTTERLRMARIPEGAALIDNAASVAPGFTVENVHVMAGVPRVFEAMVAWLLPRLAAGQRRLSQNLRVMQAESEISGPLRDIAAAHPDLSLGSYPFSENGQFGANIVIRGTDPAAIDAAMAQLKEAFPNGTT
ncbi:competence/damage-inducible protein A [Rhodalgimonas zhirmunskyi]|uniref:Molybdopterin-binding protein n=1 Tax=Rhodalgimonas zhirmunskyi TaxID=2964767 RepID=A0AAJ1X7K4_9RHOB|nr:molybdopterin-binding protein [Rhodoalgimonas zhirmunskyi]MDQ2095784.1 molybdopterin-binding protein [Rhodoalgimonas zhirmunskyi]